MTCHKPTRYTIVEESRTSQPPYESVRRRSLNSDRTRSCRLHQNHRASAIEPEQPHPDSPLPGLGFLVRPSPLPSGEAGHALMATAPAPADPKAEAAKMDLLEDDDEFEEFEIDQEWDDKDDGNEAAQQWEDDWDDDDVNDDFSLQLRKELEEGSA